MPSPNRGPERPAGMPAEAETFGTEVAGFVGAGAMGAPMIAAIAAGGFRLRVFDAEPSRAQAAVDTARRGRDDADCATVGTLAEMAGCDLVITMLPDGSAVEQVAGERGLAALLRPGSLVVDMSSSAPAQTLALHQTLTARGLRLMDAPVSGGVARARDRALTIIAGGDPPDLAYARPVLQTMGSAIYHVGGTGSGHAAKALNNVLSACGLLISVEAIEAGRRFGLEPEVLLDLVNHSTGRNHATETKIAQFVLSGKYDSGFRARLMLKDLGIADGLFAETGVRADLSSALRQAWEALTLALPDDADQTEIARIVADSGR